MSVELHDYAARFVSGKLTADEFVDKFIDKWREERDSGDLLLDDPRLSERLSSIFCCADLYNPENNRKEYEFDALQLTTEVRKLLGL